MLEMVPPHENTPTKARTKLGGEPEVDFPAPIKMMLAHDLRRDATKADIQVHG